MTTTFRPSPAAVAPEGVTTPAIDLTAAVPPARRRARWPLWGLAAGMTGWAASLAPIQDLSDEQYLRGPGIVDQLHRGGFHASFLLGLVSVGCLLVAASGWRRWAEQRAGGDLAARTLAQGLTVTATINVIFHCVAGALALYLPGGADGGRMSQEALFVDFTLLDFGSLLGWWGVAVSAVCVTVLAFRRSALLPRWMGVVSVVLLLPPVLMAALVALPGFVGLTLPIWLVVISVGMVFSRRAQAPAAL